MDSFDVFHFHDLYMAISPRTLGAIARRRPVAFTVHDCSAFTGGCLYPMECARFRESCGSCPKLREIGRIDFTRSNLKRLRRLARGSPVNYAFPSRWIQDEASRSLRFVGEAVHLPNGFDPRPYDYRGRKDARTALGLGHKKRIVAVSSASLEDNRKGLAYALRALAANRDLSPHVVIIGRSPPGIDQALQGLDFTLAGFVTERCKLGLFFAAADLLLFTSLADNLPITVQEAMAASTPVLAFDVGGVPELVRPGSTGWLVPKGDQEALNRQLREVLQSSDTTPFGNRAQAMMRDEFSVATCIDRHVSLYRKVLESAHSRGGGL
jgi:glycosyltransferase involved in cell wall biosynthesis